MWGRSFKGAYSLDDLLAGDPWAWGTLSVILVALLAFGIVWLKTAREMRREEEARAEARRREAQELKARKVGGRVRALPPAQRQEAQGRKVRKGRGIA
jgi:hypothetical protein